MKKLDKRLLAALISVALVIVGFTIAKAAETSGWTVKVDRSISPPTKAMR